MHRFPTPRCRIPTPRCSIPTPRGMKTVRFYRMLQVCLQMACASDFAFALRWNTYNFLRNRSITTFFRKDFRTRNGLRPPRTQDSYMFPRVGFDNTPNQKEMKHRRRQERAKKGSHARSKEGAKKQPPKKQQKTNKLRLAGSAFGVGKKPPKNL